VEPERQPQIFGRRGCACSSKLSMVRLAMCRSGRYGDARRGFGGRVWLSPGRCGTMTRVGSRIEAVIYDGAGQPAGLPRGQLVVPLPGALTMLPVTEELAAALDQAAVGDERICPQWPLLRQPAAALARQLSAGRRALYIVAETFGGAGTQEAIGWQDGRLLYGPSGTCDIEADLEPGYHLISRCDGAVNAGLRVLGVRAVPGQDEYQAVGLARCRHTEEWVVEVAPPAGPAGLPAG
jgi:hypothetical protein